MKIATWNVNSIRARLEQVLDILRTNQYHTLFLQETKCTNQDFAEAREMIEDAGYNVLYSGQKSYNGVAILSKSRIEDTRTDLHPGDEQARYMEAVIDGFLMINIYLPNGNPINSSKFTYKLSWMDSLIKRVQEIASDPENKLVLAGDFNVAPADLDCCDPKTYKDDAVTQKESREKFEALLRIGMKDSLREQNSDKVIYTYWGYRGFAWRRNAGLRLDHILISPKASEILLQVGVNPSVRGNARASDHCIVWAEFEG